MLENGDTRTDKGTDQVTAIYEKDQWRLCDSRWHGHVHRLRVRLDSRILSPSCADSTTCAGPAAHDVSPQPLPSACSSPPLPWRNPNWPASSRVTATSCSTRGREYRFISFNIPNLHYVEDDLRFDQVSAWRFPDAFEVHDAIATIVQTGGRVARMYALSVRRPADDPALPRYVTGPGAFNEEAFQALDRVLEGSATNKASA